VNFVTRDRRISRRPALAGLLVFLLAAVCGVFGGAEPSSAQQPAAGSGSITVSAAISLKDALGQLGPMYEKRVPGAKVIFNFGGSGTLAQQIEQGAPVDVFFSAATKEMNDLTTAGLVSGAPVDVVANSLVLITPKDQTSVMTLENLTAPSVKKIALGEPRTVPAGMYARESLGKLGLLGGLEPKFVYAKDVRAVLTFVETGNANAGFVYVTDALQSQQVRTVVTVPADSHDAIEYPAAVLKNSKNPELAKAFLDFLAGSDAMVVFQTFGFTPPEKTATKP
jgi:molybdate transport system substrate-binding protein